MKNTSLLMVALCAALAGCQTGITAEKHPEQLLPIYKVSSTNGTNTPYVADYVRASGGWYATARSPLWANEQFAKMAVAVNPDGTLSFGVDGYSRDLSTNAVTLCHNLVTDIGVLAEKAAAAYATCGASLAASAGKKAVQKAIAKYIARGGSADAAKVRAEGGNLVFSDGLGTEGCENCLVTEVEH